jgi:hypothetical protein
MTQYDCRLLPPHDYWHKLSRLPVVLRVPAWLLLSLGRLAMGNVGRSAYHNIRLVRNLTVQPQPNQHSHWHELSRLLLVLNC